VNHSESRWLIFVLSFLLFAWPFIAFENSRHASWVYFFVFASWGISVALIFAFMRHEQQDDSESS